MPLPHLSIAIGKAKIDFDAKIIENIGLSKENLDDKKALKLKDNLDKILTNFKAGLKNVDLEKDSNEVILEKKFKFVEFIRGADGKIQIDKKTKASKSNSGETQKALFEVAKILGVKIPGIEKPPYLSPLVTAIKRARPADPKVQMVMKYFIGEMDVLANNMSKDKKIADEIHVAVGVVAKNKSIPIPDMLRGALGVSPALVVTPIASRILGVGGTSWSYPDYVTRVFKVGFITPMGTALAASPKSEPKPKLESAKGTAGLVVEQVNIVEAQPAPAGSAAARPKSGAKDAAGAAGKTGFGERVRGFFGGDAASKAKADKATADKISAEIEKNNGLINEAVKELTDAKEAVDKAVQAVRAREAAAAKSKEAALAKAEAAHVKLESLRSEQKGAVGRLQKLLEKSIGIGQEDRASAEASLQVAAAKLDATSATNWELRQKMANLEGAARVVALAKEVDKSSSSVVAALKALGVANRAVDEEASKGGKGVAAARKGGELKTTKAAHDEAERVTRELEKVVGELSKLAKTSQGISSKDIQSGKLTKGKIDISHDDRATVQKLLERVKIDLAKIKKAQGELRQKEHPEVTAEIADKVAARIMALTAINNSLDTAMKKLNGAKQAVDEAMLAVLKNEDGAEGKKQNAFGKAKADYAEAKHVSDEQKKVMDELRGLLKQEAISEKDRVKVEAALISAEAKFGKTSKLVEELRQKEQHLKGSAATAAAAAKIADEAAPALKELEASEPTLNVTIAELGEAKKAVEKAMQDFADEKDGATESARTALAAVKAASEKVGSVMEKQVDLVGKLDKSCKSMMSIGANVGGRGAEVAEAFGKACKNVEDIQSAKVALDESVSAAENLGELQENLKKVKDDLTTLQMEIEKYRKSMFFGRIFDSFRKLVGWKTKDKELEEHLEAVESAQEAIEHTATATLDKKNVDVVERMLSSIDAYGKAKVAKGKAEKALSTVWVAAPEEPAPVEVEEVKFSQQTASVNKKSI